MTENKCFICSGIVFNPIFSGRIINNHKLYSCKACGSVIAQGEQGYDMDYSNYGDYLVGESSWRNHLSITKKIHEPLFRKLSLQHKKTILDFGAGAGFFVKAAKDYGLKAFGFEPSNKLREFAATNLGMSLFNDFDEIEDKFDAICMFDVIEHIPALIQRNTMSSLLDKLEPGGLFIGNTPNIKSANIWLSKENDPAVWPPSHCCYFTTDSLDKYLKSLGLNKQSLYTKGFRSIRSKKENLSFLEKPTTSSIFKWTVVFPLKAILRLVSLIISPFGFGYQIYFVYQKP